MITQLSTLLTKSSVRRCGGIVSTNGTPIPPYMSIAGYSKCVGERVTLFEKDLVIDTTPHGAAKGLTSITTFSVDAVDNV